jgi:hypothetical protein
MEQVDLDDDDVLVKYFQSLMKNSLMLMNDIHQHLNLQMKLMLAVQYDLKHNREHSEPKKATMNIILIKSSIFTVCDETSFENQIDGCSVFLSSNISVRRERISKKLIRFSGI